jgi:hypothetical protein
MYTSGRTVKSRDAKRTTVATATADIRKLVNRHLRDVQGVTVDSNGTAHPVTLASQIRTVVTFPEAADVLDFFRAATDRFDDVEWGTCRITITRTV